MIINELEASWIGYRAQGVQPVFVGEANPVHQELIKVQREIFNRVWNILKPGVTVKELAELTIKTAESSRAQIRSGSGRARRLEHAWPRRRRRRPDYHRPCQEPAPTRRHAARKHGLHLQTVGSRRPRPIPQPPGATPSSSPPAAANASANGPDDLAVSGVKEAGVGGPSSPHFHQNKTNGRGARG